VKPILFVATANPENSLAFYREILGLTLTEDLPQAFVFDANGNQLRVQKVQRVVVQPYTSAGWEVQKIESLVKNLTNKGVVMERFPFLQQDDAGLWIAPDGAKIAWFKDPDENLLSLTEFPPDR